MRRSMPQVVVRDPPRRDADHLRHDVGREPQERAHRAVGPVEGTSPLTLYLRSLLLEGRECDTHVVENSLRNVSEHDSNALLVKEGGARKVVVHDAPRHRRRRSNHELHAGGTERCLCPWNQLEHPISERVRVRHRGPGLEVLGVGAVEVAERGLMLDDPPRRLLVWHGASERRPDPGQ